MQDTVKEVVSMENWRQDLISKTFPLADIRKSSVNKSEKLLMQTDLTQKHFLAAMDIFKQQNLDLKPGDIQQDLL